MTIYDTPNPTPDEHRLLCAILALPESSTRDEVNAAIQIVRERAAKARIHNRGNAFTNAFRDLEIS